MIPPNGGTGGGRVPPPRGGPGKSARADAPDAHAVAAERDAQNRIHEAGQRAQEAERESRTRIDDVHDEYVRRVEAQSAQQEDALAAEKAKGYKAIRDVQRAQAQELSRVKREGDLKLEDLRNYYRDSIYSTETKGNTDLQHLKAYHAGAVETETREHNMALEQARAEAGIQMAQERAAQESSQTELVNQGHVQYEKMKKSVSEATQRAQEHFNERYANTVDKLETSLSDLQHKTGTRLEEIREETAGKLAAFNDQKSDPFYRLVDIGARMQETSDAFIVVAKIPVHERDHVSVSLKGENLVISGSRRNEDDLEVSPGHTIRTAAFQSYNESFPLKWPVEGKQLSRRFDGDYLIVEVPKKRYLEKPKPFEANRPERARAERPKFPSNIPYSEPSQDLSRRPLAPDKQLKTRKGGSTLS